jgi:ribonuclease BN (tRNA processing enzyme)
MSEQLSVTVLGCDGSYPGPGGACSGYLLSSGETHVWLDAGSGTMANLQKHISLEQLTAVVISHQHPDHWTDVEHLAVACKWVIKRSGIPIFVPDGLRLLMRVGAAVDVFDWHIVGGGDQIEIGAMAISFSETDHVATTLAVRVDSGGRSFGYSADTGSGWHLSALGSGLHLALCEATFLADKEDTIPHLSARQAGQMAREAGVEHLVITHLWPRLDRELARTEAAASFGGDVTVAAIGDRYGA